MEVQPGREIMQWLEDPLAEAENIASIDHSKATVRRLLMMSTPESATNIAVGSMLNPTIPAELLVGADVAGMPTEDDMLAQAAELDLETSRTIGGIGGFFGRAGDILRGATRWTALAFNGLYDELINRPLRTAVNVTTRGLDIGEAYAESGNAPFASFGEAIAQGLDPDTHVNIGTGWLPNSQLSTPVSEALAQLQADGEIIGAGDSPERNQLYQNYAQQYGYKAPTFISDNQQQMMFLSGMREVLLEQAGDQSTELGRSQAEFGDPIVQRQRAEADSVIMNLNPGRVQGGENYSQVSIGRVFASLITESGTSPFHWTSGTLDFLANIFMDPANIVGVGIAQKSKHLRQLTPGPLARTVVDAVEEAEINADEIIAAAQAIKGDKAGAWSRYDNFTPDSKVTANRLADEGISLDDVADGTRTQRDYDYQQAGRAHREYEDLQIRMSELVNDPDFKAVEGWQASTRAKFHEGASLTIDEATDLLTGTQNVARYDRAVRARKIRTAIVDVGARIEELRTSTIITQAAKWPPTWRARMMKLADEADYDPKVNPNKARDQKTAREARDAMEELQLLDEAVDELAVMSTWEVQARAAAGISDGVHKNVDPNKVKEFISGPTAVRFIDRFVDAKTLDEVDAGLKHIKGDIPNELRLNLLDAEDRVEVIGALLPKLSQVADTGMGVATKLIVNPVAAMHKATLGRFGRALANKGMSNQKGKPLFSGSKVMRWFTEMSPSSLNLDDLPGAYGALVLHAKNIGWKRGDEVLEGHLRKFLELDDMDYNGAFKVLTDYRVDSIARLTDDGLDPAVARAVTQFIGSDSEHSIYHINKVGQTIADGKVMIEGKVVTDIDPMLYSELFKGVVQMPNPRLVRHAANELDALGRRMNWIATQGVGQAGADAAFRQRSLVRITNTIMTKVWKPSVLLRIAWPVRVVGEEQFRLMASGTSQILSHPIHFIARILHGRKAADVKGDMFSEAERFSAASSGRTSFQGDYRPGGRQFWTTVKRPDLPGGATPAQYREAALKDIRQIWSDPISRYLFKKRLAGGTTAAAKDAPTAVRSIEGVQTAPTAWVTEAAQPGQLRPNVDNPDALLHGPTFRTQGALIDDIAEKGIQEPLQLSLDDKGQMVLREGYHRLAAAIDLGIEEVPVVVALSDDAAAWARGGFKSAQVGASVRGDVDELFAAGNYNRYFDLDEIFGEIPWAETASRAKATSELNAIDDTTAWLDTGAGKPLLDDLMRNADPATKRKFYDEGPEMRTDTIRFYVEEVNARAHAKAGGNWRVVRAEMGPDGQQIGRWIDAEGNTGYIDTKAGEVIPDRATYEILEVGIDELVDSYGTGKWRGIRVADRMADTKKALKDDPSLVDANRVRKELDKLIASEDGARLPQVFKGTAGPTSDDIAGFDKAVNWAFDVLMTRPTNRLSRHPTFHVWYYRFLGEQYPMMDKATQAAARAGAKAADADKFLSGGALSNFNKAAKDAAKLAKKRGGPEAAGLLKGLDSADEIAKGMALTKVQDLLFDVSKRHNIADALSIVAPFAEAWGEVITTWAKIVRQENLRPFRRFQQVIESGRESAMFDPASGYTNEGFFYENDQGQEVFTIPGVNELWSSIAGVEKDWEYSLLGLSIATSVLPATGPVVSFPAQAIIPDESGWDFLRDMVAPFGATSLQRGLTPSSWQRLIASFDWGRNIFSDQALIDTYNNAVKDALAMMEREDPEGFQERLRTNEEGVMTDARHDASQLFWVQALARFVGPAAPSTKSLIQAGNGSVYLASMLHDDYFKISEKHQGDRIATVEEFIGKYGISPFGVIQAKSVEIEPRGETDISYDWERDNQDIYDQWGEIAYYLGPAWLDDVVPYSWNAFYNGLVEGTREQTTPEEFFRQMNDAKGQFIYAKRKRDFEEMAGRAKGQEILKWNDAGWPQDLKQELAIELRNLGADLMEEYPGYTGPDFDSDVAGIPSKVDIKVQMTKLADIIVKRPDLLELSVDGEPVNPALYAASVYMQYREQAFEAAQTNDVDRATEPFGRGRGDLDSPYYKIRQDLRLIAAQLIVRFPEFGPMWEGVLGRELVNDDDVEMTIEDAYRIIYGEGS